jgi:hypothetical protein
LVPSQIAGVVRHELSCKGVGFFRRADFSQQQLLNQPVLKRQMCTFNTALGRTGAQMPVMFSSFITRPNYVWPSPPAAFLLLMRKMLALTL